MRRQSLTRRQRQARAVLPRAIAFLLFSLLIMGAGGAIVAHDLMAESGQHLGAFACGVACYALIIGGVASAFCAWLTIDAWAEC